MKLTMTLAQVTIDPASVDGVGSVISVCDSKSLQNEIELHKACACYKHSVPQPRAVSSGNRGSGRTGTRLRPRVTCECRTPSYVVLQDERSVSRGLVEVPHLNGQLSKEPKYIWQQSSKRSSTLSSHLPNPCPSLLPRRRPAQGKRKGRHHLARRVGPKVRFLRWLQMRLHRSEVPIVACS